MNGEIFGDEVRVDFTNIPTNDWPPEGPHLARVVKCDPQRAKDGSPLLYWEFEVISDDGTQYRRVWTNTSLKPQALWRLRDLVNACGVYPGPDGFKRSEVVGKMLRIMIEHERFCKKHQAKDDCPDADVFARVSDYAPAG